MKNFLLLFLLAFSMNNLSAQCELPFGDMEVWQDVTPVINDYYYTNLDAETILLPETMDIYIRGLFLAFGVIDIDQILMESAPERIGLEIFGVSRSTESRTGAYSLKIGGDTNVGFSDLLYLGQCGDMTTPASLSFYYKHFGETTDSLTIVAAMGPSGIALLEADSLTDDVFAGTAIDSFYLSGDINATWQFATFDYVVNNDQITNDSIAFFITRQGPADSTHYFLVDDIQWNIETPTVDTEGQFIFQLGQSLDSRTLFLQLDHNAYTFQSIVIYDAAGRQVMKPITEWKASVDVDQLAEGNYFLQVVTDKGTYAKPFVRY